VNAALKKTFLFVFQHAPHENLHAKEGLDFAFSCAAFDQQVDVLFVEDGVYHLLKNQNTEAIKQKNHSASIDALSLFGIEHCFYSKTCTNKRNINKQQLLEGSQALETEQYTQLLNNYDMVFTY
jgi:tRNA 2-thiouridine synthesizing protein C